MNFITSTPRALRDAPRAFYFYSPRAARAAASPLARAHDEARGVLPDAPGPSSIRRFATVWKLVRPLVDPKTVHKVRITRPGAETLAALREVCDDDVIPAVYGGANADPEASQPERRLRAELARRAWGS